MRRRKWAQFALGLLSALALIWSAWLSNQIAVFNKHRARLELLAQSQDPYDSRYVKQELDVLESFYERADRLQLRWLADRILFKDAKLYEAIYYYRIGYYDFVKTILENSDDPRALNLQGAALFLSAREFYLKGQKEKTLQLATEDAHAFFRQAVEKDRNQTFAYKWNYDLTANPRDAERALASPRPQPAIILGWQSEEEAESDGRQPRRGNRMLDPEKQGAGADPQRPRRP